MPTNNISQTVGQFLPTTNVWDVSQVYAVDVNSRDFKELLVRLYQNINNIALAVNLKDTGYLPLQEFVSGKLLFPNPSLSSLTVQFPAYRQAYRKVINFGALPNMATKSVPHGITVTGKTTFITIEACASNTTGHSYIPIPYASPTSANNIEINVDATNVNIITGSNRTGYTICYVMLEYVQQ